MQDPGTLAPNHLKLSMFWLWVGIAAHQECSVCFGMVGRPAEWLKVVWKNSGVVPNDCKVLADVEACLALVPNPGCHSS